MAVATRSAAQRRSVAATAVVESTERGAFVESQTGQRSFPVYGHVRGVGLILLAAAAINFAVET